MNKHDFIRAVAERDHAQHMSWGQISWLAGNIAQMMEAEQTFGVVTINPGQHNPLHSHPNCEELLYVLSGECDHVLGDALFHLTPGMVIRIPRGVPHNAHCTSSEPLTAVISFSSPDRRTDTLEGDTA